MIKCPYCGSTAQVKLQSIDHMESSKGICAIRYYKCGCGKYFDSTQWYIPDENGEKIGDFTW